TACVYFVVCYYNDLEIRELSVHRQKDYAAVQQQLQQQFLSTGIAQFVLRGQSQISSSIAADSSSGTVTDTTTATASPFVPMPMFAGVPGLGANMTFTVSQTRSMDENR